MRCPDDLLWVETVTPASDAIKAATNDLPFYELIPVSIVREQAQVWDPVNLAVAVAAAPPLPDACFEMTPAWASWLRS